MPRRTQRYSQIPWTGGLNSSVDSGVMPANDLVKADNVIFGSSGSRLKREGLDYIDTDPPVPSSRSSSGTTRSLIFDDAVDANGDELFVVGEKITVVGSGAGNEASYDVTNAVITAISTDTTTNDTIEYVATGTLAETKTATSTVTVTRGWSVLGLTDFWYTDSSNVKQQLSVCSSEQMKLFTYNSQGARSEMTLDGAATSQAGTITKVTTEAINQKLVIAFDGVGNVPKKFEPNTATDTWYDLGGTPPDFSIMKQHQSRLWANDKTDPDRIHYSSPFNPEEWNGAGDSGALDLATGDNDPEGLTAIFPTFKGVLFVAKRTKLYMVEGDAPENYKVTPVSNGLGCISHDSVVPIDVDDIAYASEKGFHSLVATASYGDFEGRFLSAKIQPDFNNFPDGRLKYTKGTYIPSLNSIAYSISESGESEHSNVWFFNPTVQHKDETRGAWYRWPSVSCQSITTRLRGGTRKIIFGTNNGRLIQAQNSLYSDFGSTGISYNIKTGTIYVDNNPETLKIFKAISFYFRPVGTFSFTAKVTIDNDTTQSLTFSDAPDGDLLGSTFVLGTSVLGAGSTLAPFTASIDGVGRGIMVEIIQNTSGAQVELYGFSVEYESAEYTQEVI